MAVALFMALGLALSEKQASGVATVIAVALTVALPAVASIALARSHFGGGGRGALMREALRQQTIESEVLRLAIANKGRLTVVEIVAELAVSAEQAQVALDSLTRREFADIALTDSGVLVYTFRDIERVGDKAKARGLLQ